MRRHLLLCLLIFFAACSARRAAPSASTRADDAGGSPELTGGSLRDALVLAERTGRNVLIEYWSPTCTFCTRMDRQRAADPKIEEALTRVVWLRMVKGGDAGSFEARWGSPGTPSYVVVSPVGGQRGDLVTGTVAPADFASYLDWAVEADGPPPALTLGGA